jgi:MinD-like ATPase involved in chromosome partitioning or flagellar assembly
MVMNKTQEKNFPVKSKLLAIWGSPSSGKTVVSVKLANFLASRKQNVTLVLCDVTAPPLPLIIAPSELENEASLGSVLSAPIITEQTILQNCMTLKKREYIAIIGMLRRENAFTYPSYTKEQAKGFLNQLRQLEGTIIIDCTSIIASDVLSALVLEMADKVIRLISCDLKSISYFSSQLPLLADSRFSTEKHIKCASSVKSMQAEQHVSAVFKGVQYSLPYCPEVEEQYLNGDVFKDMQTNAGKKYSKEIEKMAGELFE